MMKHRLCAVSLALLLALCLSACRFEFELGGIKGGVHLELPQKTPEGWQYAGPSAQAGDFWQKRSGGYGTLGKPVL